MKGILTLLLILFSETLMAQYPDLILSRGKIFTADANQPIVEAIAIAKGRITAIGTSEQIEKRKGPGTKWIDLHGRLVVPGFNDAHNHLPEGLDAVWVNFPESEMDPSWTVLLDSLREKVRTTPKGKLIQASIGPSIANSPAANRVALDAISKDHPIRLLSWWGHVAIFNTSAFAFFGIPEGTTDPKGGFYERLEDKKTLSGKAFEKNAYSPHTSYQRLLSQRNETVWAGRIQAESNAWLALGITSYQNMCTGAPPEDFRKLFTSINLPVRMRLIRWGDVNTDGSLSLPNRNVAPLSNSQPLVTVTGTKWLLDGTPIEGGAAQTEDYPGRAGWKGRLNYSDDEIRSMLKEVVQRKDQPMFHVVGDRAVSKLLSLMEEMEVDWPARRVRFEHADGADYAPENLRRIKKLGIIIVQNPTHFIPPPGNVTEAKYGMALQSLLKAGIPLAIGSDGAFNPFLNILIATTHPQRPSEALTREEAIIAYTRTAAFAEFAEQEKGTLTAGKLADLAILSQDILVVPLPQLMNTRSLMTLVAGRVVFDTRELHLQ